MLDAGEAAGYGRLMEIRIYRTYHLVKSEDLNHHGTLYAGRNAEWFVEAGFIAYLKLKQSFALAGSQDEKAAITAESCGSFIRDHLANMAQSFSDRLQESGIAYLAKAGAALARRVGPGPAPSPFPILQDTDAQDDLGCGSVNVTS